MKPIPVSADMGFKISQGKRNLWVFDSFRWRSQPKWKQISFVIRELIINRIEYNSVSVSVVVSSKNVRQVLNVMFYSFSYDKTKFLNDLYTGVHSVVIGFST